MYWDDEFALKEYDKPGWDIWPELLDCQDLWSDTYRSYWGLDTDPAPSHLTDTQWESAKATDGLAEVTLKMALALSAQGAFASGPQPEYDHDELKRLRRALRSHAS